VLSAPAYVWTLARGLGVPAKVLAMETFPPIAASVVMVTVVLIARALIGAWPIWAQLAASITLGAGVFVASLTLICGRRLMGDIREFLPRRLAL
jgi:hypothetical protein